MGRSDGPSNCPSSRGAPWEGIEAKGRTSHDGIEIGQGYRRFVWFRRRHLNDLVKGCMAEISERNSGYTVREPFLFNCKFRLEGKRFRTTLQSPTISGRMRCTLDVGMCLRSWEREYIKTNIVRNR
jgi:hypothetical protein